MNPERRMNPATWMNLTKDERVDHANPDPVNYRMWKEQGQLFLMAKIDENAKKPEQDTELHVTNVPRFINIQTFYEFFNRVGNIYLIRFFTEYSGFGRGYCYLKYFTHMESLNAICILKGCDILPSYAIDMCISFDAKTLLLEGVPDKHSLELVQSELEKIFQFSKIQRVPLDGGVCDYMIEFEAHYLATKVRKENWPQIFIIDNEYRLDWAYPNTTVRTARINFENIHERLSKFDMIQQMIPVIDTNFITDIYKKGRGGYLLFKCEAAAKFAIPKLKNLFVRSNWVFDNNFRKIQWKRAFESGLKNRKKSPVPTLKGNNWWNDNMSTSSEENFTISASNTNNQASGSNILNSNSKLVNKSPVPEYWWQSSEENNATREVPNVYNQPSSSNVLNVNSKTFTSSSNKENYATREVPNANNQTSSSNNLNPNAKILSSSPVPENWWELNTSTELSSDGDSAISEIPEVNKQAKIQKARSEAYLMSTIDNTKECDEEIAQLNQFMVDFKFENTTLTNRPSRPAIPESEILFVPTPYRGKDNPLLNDFNFDASYFTGSYADKHTEYYGVVPYQEFVVKPGEELTREDIYGLMKRLEEL